jgi:uncharacterized phage protein (TIGR01671 family)
MRELKFRGKLSKDIRPIYGNQWRYGTPVFYESGEVCIFPMFSEYGHEATEIYRRDKVDPETLDQYTGRKDSYRKEIYESDIIQDNLGIGYIEYVTDYAAFRVNYGNGECKWFYSYLDDELKTIKVIGNIHENPELLKEEK